MLTVLSLSKEDPEPVEGDPGLGIKTLTPDLWSLSSDKSCQKIFY